MLVKIVTLVALVGKAMAAERHPGGRTCNG